MTWKLRITTIAILCAYVPELVTLKYFEQSQPIVNAKYMGTRKKVQGQMELNINLLWCKNFWNLNVFLIIHTFHEFFEDPWYAWISKMFLHQNKHLFIPSSMNFLMLPHNCSLLWLKVFPSRTLQHEAFSKIKLTNT